MATNSASHDKSRGLILGIESSCDETAAAVVACGHQTLSTIVASQTATHAAWGGVVPELASREHLRNIVPIVRAALHQANMAFNDLDAIAVTSGPGLAGALLVGISYAKALAFSLDKPLIAVNHLEGHIHAVLLEHSQQSVEPLPMPTLALVVSGGHTHLFLAAPPSNISSAEQATWRYTLLGRTLDDAAGEAFDKVAKLLGLGYPGGPWIDRLAPFGDPRAVPFALTRIKSKPHLVGKTPRTKAAITSPVTMLDPRFLFSFSGLKTAVLRYVEENGLRAGAATREAALQAAIASGHTPALDQVRSLCDQPTLDLIASFQSAVVDNLLHRSFDAADKAEVRSLLVTGGVAANSELRRRFRSEAERRGLPIAFPTLAMSTDNAAMIAAAAWPRFLAGEFARLDLEADPRLVLA
jgi:N6-L-threonylcarbamoyladenine synthase